jgi:hypothetical protein
MGKKVGAIIFHRPEPQKIDRLRNTGYRQHHPNGNLELPWQIHLNLRINLAELNTEEGLKEFLYLAHIYQALLKIST